MIEIEYCNDDLTTFELDIFLFKKKYPSIYEQYKGKLDGLSYYDLEDIIPNNDLVFDLIQKQESIILWLENGTDQIIYNTDILSWFHGYEDGYAIQTDSKFVYFIIYSPYGQAGALGIWDTDKEDWIFNRNDESFCVETIFYFNMLDAFVGYYEWNIPMSPQHGERFFIIDKNRSYREIKSEKIYDISNCTNSDVDYLDSHMPLNMDMKSQFSSNNHMWLIVDIKQKLAVVNDNNRKKILSAYKLQILEVV